MRCAFHPEVWLYENMMETKGFCPKCQSWYDLKLDRRSCIICGGSNYSRMKEFHTGKTILYICSEKCHIEARRRYLGADLANFVKT